MYQWPLMRSVIPPIPRLYMYVAGAQLPDFELLHPLGKPFACPVFVFLVGTAFQAISIERMVYRGIDSWQIDKDKLMRGALMTEIQVLLSSPITL